jgi:hypothetical protein
MKYMMFTAVLEMYRSNYVVTVLTSLLQYSHCPRYEHCWQGGQ